MSVKLSKLFVRIRLNLSKLFNKMIKAARTFIYHSNFWNDDLVEYQLVYKERLYMKQQTKSTAQMCSEHV